MWGQFCTWGRFQKACQKKTVSPKEKWQNRVKKGKQKCTKKQQQQLEAPAKDDIVSAEHKDSGSANTDREGASTGREGASEEKKIVRRSKRRRAAPSLLQDEWEPPAKKNREVKDSDPGRSWSTRKKECQHLLKL